MPKARKPKNIFTGDGNTGAPLGGGSFQGVGQYTIDGLSFTGSERVIKGGVKPKNLAFSKQEADALATKMTNERVSRRTRRLEKKIDNKILGLF